MCETRSNLETQSIPYLFIAPQIIIIHCIFLWRGGAGRDQSFLLGKMAFCLSSQFVWFKNMATQSLSGFLGLQVPGHDDFFRSGGRFSFSASAFALLIGRF